MDYNNQLEGQVSCPACGQTLTAGSRFCPYCGASMTGIGGDNGRVPAGTTKKEFRKKYASQKLYKDLRNASIASYILCAINLVFSPLDGVILTVLTLGTHLMRSKGFAIAQFVFSICSTLIMQALSGTPGGWLWIVLGWLKVSTFNKMDKEYEQAVQGAPEF